MNDFLIIGIIISVAVIIAIELSIKGIKHFLNKKKNKSQIMLDMSGKLFSMSKKEASESIFKINDLLKTHFEKVLNAQINNPIAINYLESVMNFILSEVSVKSSEKYIQLLSDNIKHTFVLKYGSESDISVFYIELYPSDKNSIKMQNFRESYLNELNNICEILFRQINLSIDRFRNSTFFHIMFFITNDKIEIEMGIQSVRHNFGHAPLDLLSEKDHIKSGL